MKQLVSSKIRIENSTFVTLLHFEICDGTPHCVDLMHKTNPTPYFQKSRQWIKMKLLQFEDTFIWYVHKTFGVDPSSTFLVKI